MARDALWNKLAAGPGPRDEARLPGHATATLLTIVICQFMIGLDATVVNIALPKIRAALHFTPTSLAWVVSAYILAFGGLLLLGGRTGDILGRRRMFMSGLSLFAVASLFGGLATSVTWLLSARVAQGVGAAFAAPSALALVTANFREGKERDRALAVVTGSYAASLIVGLIAGGMITAWASWRWVMFINVPITIALLVLAPLFISEAERHRARFDLTGALLSIGVMTALVYGFLQAASSGWHGAVTIAMFPAAAVLLAALIVAETRAEQPIIPLRLLRHRGRSASYLNLLILTGPMAAMNFFVTQLLQNVLGFSPLTAGLAFLPMGVALMAAGGLSMQLLRRTGHRPIVIAGIVLVGGGLFWLSRFSVSSTYASGILVPSVIMGLGVGSSFTAVNEMILSGVSGRDSGAASSLLEAMQWLGSVLGLSILVTVFGAASRHAASHLPPGLNAPGTTRYVLVHGMSVGFTGAIGFTGLALAVTLLGIRRPAAAGNAAAGEPGTTAAAESGADSGLPAHLSSGQPADSVGPRWHHRRAVAGGVAALWRAIGISPARRSSTP